MATAEHPKRRQRIRREEDHRLRRHIDRYTQLFYVSQIITSELDFDTLFNLIIEQITRIIDTERCSVFLVDDQDEKLRAFVSSDLKRDEFSIPKDHGIAGWVFTNKTPLLINDAYKDPRFFPGVDKQTGFTTKSILCVPLLSRSSACIGTLQVLNKKGGDFSYDDRELLTYIAAYVTIAIENSKLYGKLKAADEVKNKVIHHLSHELKTPITLLDSSLKIIERQLAQTDPNSDKRVFDRARRSLQRLQNMQEKVMDIMHQVECADRRMLHTLLDHCADTLETLAAEHVGDGRIVDCMRQRIEEIFGVPADNPEEIVLNRFVNDQVESMRSSFTHRRLALTLDLDQDVRIQMHTDTLRKVVRGLIKNAVENTPDGGQIRVAVNNHEAGAEFIVSDTGIGIIDKLQSRIFEGFYPTQETLAYATKKPFDFNAGGNGVDLLRMKIFADRLDFQIEMDSQRCRHIPLGSDVCPGAIDHCAHCGIVADCYQTGGTMFKVTFANDSTGFGASLKE